MAPPDFGPSTLPAQALPRLVRIDISSSQSALRPPIKRIHNDADLQVWKTSEAHQTVALFVSRLAEAAVDQQTIWPQVKISDHPGIQAVIALLSRLDQWTEDIRPLDTPQRFGNLAFRDWGARLEEQSHALHQDLLADQPNLKPYIAELKAYLYDAFGSFVRIDYGSGHELTFLAWLAYLYRLGFFTEDTDDATLANSSQAAGTAAMPSAVERELALIVFPLYLAVVWKLQDRYALEPAGSHGVWGLDDYQFVPYIIGAAQLRQQNDYKPSFLARPSHKPSSSSKRPSPDELLIFRPSSSSSGPRTEEYLPPFSNLFTSSIARIHSLKTGPFFEHSPLLNDISSSVPNWKKVHGGMMKMWDAEVLSKRPVVQHFLFGGVGYPWQGGESQEGEQTQQQTVEASVPSRPPTTSMPMQPPTMAPWAKTAAPGTTAPSRLPPLGGLSLGPRVGGARGSGAGSTSHPRPEARNGSGPSLPPMTGTQAPWATKRGS